MGKKRRNTAKTGDKKLYQRRSEAKPLVNRGDDNVYNEVDRYHNRREEEEFLKLDSQPTNQDDAPDDGVFGRESVLDLGAEESSEEEEEDQLDESDEEEDGADDAEMDDDDDEVDVSSDSESENDENLAPEAFRDWGKKKSRYYHGDTADLEIGQDKQDAFLEEEAAKQVESARYEQMDDDDFGFPTSQEKDIDSEDVIQENQRIGRLKDVAKLSVSERQRLLRSHHPELLPLTAHFAEELDDWLHRTHVVSNALLGGKDNNAKSVGATNLGLEFLTTKALMQTSAALNVAVYLLLKMENAKQDHAEDDSSKLHAHPVLSRLQEWNSLEQKLHDGVENRIKGLPEQVDTLAKAAGLLGTIETRTEDDEVSNDDEDDAPPDRMVVESASDEDSDQESEEDDEAMQRELLNDAKFALRPSEISTSGSERRQRRLAPSDFGDEDKDEMHAKKASRSLASTINTIEQRSKVRNRKGKANSVAEDLDNEVEENDELRRGLEMMEAELGRSGSDEDGEEIDDELEESGDSFYDSIAKRSKAKKEMRKSLYAVKPKYPSMEEEVEGERPISKTILKNRGLVAHKAKINRNPRVKKREQYRKALIRRKGKVREVRTGEGHKYGGEATGIKSRISRSRKLGVR